MQIDGRSVVVNDETITLTTSAATLESFTPDWRTQFLAVITNPTVAYMLMLLGIYGLIFEGYNPGAIVPGVVGAISLLLALFAFQILPVNYAGLALILLGAILMTAEFLVPSFGALGFGGVAAFIFGSLILFDTDVPGFAIARPIIAAIAAAAALTLLGIIWFAMRSRVRPVVSGAQQMIGMPGVALADFADEGPARVHGEVWRARSATPITKGQSLTITGIDGLTLYVEPAPRNQMEK
jgi:membrane-bound serine protease (ClpP class)